MSSVDWFGRFIKGWVHPGVAAFGLLTRIPIRLQVVYDEQLFRRSVVYYPLAGLLVGLIVAGCGWGLSNVLPAGVAAVLTVAIWIYVTGGLHMDGLMDTADGLFSNRSPERMLDIMRDSRVGAMGVVAGVLQIAMKIALVVALFENANGVMVGAIICVAIGSRAWMAAAIAWWPYARSESSGMGSPYQGVRKKHAIASLGASSALQFAVVLVLVQASVISLTTAWLVCLGFLLLTLALGTSLARPISRKLGGLTGDTYGAMCELIETSLLLAVVVAIGVFGVAVDV
jgi:cobalamin 5'-phosphate synthase/cobalamin synthase